MSSMQRGATGAGRPKPVNVNNLYSGRNLAAGAKPVGKHGLQSVGKSVGVVRRMPPPATLPSIKSENNGQDPTTVIVPQGGVGGWMKADSAPAEQAKAAPVVQSSGPDLRPTWAKPQNPEPVAAPAATASNREFPTLAVSSGGVPVKNAWNTASAQGDSTNEEEERQLPSRYYDNAAAKTAAGSYRSRFQGSNDARASQGGFGQRTSENERSRVDSVSDSSSSVQVIEKTHGEEGFFDSTTAHSDSTTVVTAKSASNDSVSRERAVSDVDREAAIEKNRQKRNNFRGSNDESVEYPIENPSSQRWAHPAPAPAPVPEYRLLKRPQRIELEDISDDDQEVQMTKLNKPAVRVIKRVPVGEEEQRLSDSAVPASITSKTPIEHEQPILKRRNENTANKEDSRRSVVSKAKEREQPTQRREPVVVAQAQDVPDTKVEDVIPAPPPAENIWAKRKEERESQEKEKKSCVPKAMQQAIEQHFPAVNETASVKLKKDVARRPAETEFTRAAMRAQRAPACNDVRQMMARGGQGTDERRGGNRDSVEERERSYNNGQMRDQRGDRPQREQRDYEDYSTRAPRYGDYRGERDSYQHPRENQRPYRDDRQSSVDYEHEDNGASREFTRGARRGVVSRGRSLRGGFGRGRGGAYARSHQPAPQYQLQRRGDPREVADEEVSEEHHDAETAIIAAGDSADISVQGDAGLLETSMKASDLNGSGDGEPTMEEGAERASYSSSRGKWQRGQPIRGRGEPRRGGRGSHQNRGNDMQELRGPRRGPRLVDEHDSEEAGQPSQSTRTRGSYTQQRARRGQRETRPARISHARRGSDEKSNQTNDRGDRLKSPVASSEGHDEWETASESSGRARRDDQPAREPTPSKRSHAGSATAQESESSAPSAERVRSKNGQPARRTCRSPLEGGNSSNRNNKNMNNKQSKAAAAHQTRRHSADKIADSDGLAGVDINNFSNVVVVDDYQETISPDALHEFEEVMTKSAKRQRAQEEQQRLEAEERRREKERERQERIQAKKAAAAKKREAKNEVRKDTRSADAGCNNNLQAQKAKPTQSTTVDVVVARKEVPVTTVWNSAHIGAAATEKEKQKEQDIVPKVPSVIPSPIARPTPRSKSAASDSPPAVREEPLRMVELPVSLSSSQPLRGGEKYDFTFDASIHEAQVRESQEKATASLSTGANSESGSVADDFRLKEKLNRVKDLWSGSAELEKQAEPLPLPSNVAKVKPQPQGGETPSGDDSKPPAPSTSSHSGVPAAARSPAMAPFAGNFSSLASPFPPSYMMMPDMPGYGGTSLLPPPNATSPPTMSMHGQFIQQQPQARGGPRNPSFMDSNNGYVNRNHQHSNMTWAPNAALDGVMPFGNTPPPATQQFAQFNHVQQQSRVAHASAQQIHHHHQSNVQHAQPPATSRGFGGPGQQSQQSNPSHKMVPGAGGLMTFPMEMSVPPPIPPPSHGQQQHHPHNMNVPPHQQHGAVGSQRNGAFSTSMMGGSFAQAPPPQFTQPPPAINMRYTQPPPPIGSQDLTWANAKVVSGQQHHQGQQFASGGIYRGPTQHPMMRGGGSGGPPHPPDVWSSSMNPNATSMRSFVPLNQRHMHGGMSSHHKGGNGSVEIGNRGGNRNSGETGDSQNHKAQTAGDNSA